MSDKKGIALILSLLTGAIVYQVVTEKPTRFTPAPHEQPVEQPIAVVDCVDCMDSLSSSCEFESNECFDSQDCTAWVACIEDCVVLQGGDVCYDDCDLAYTDSHSECVALHTCMCDACVGQCSDMCMADQ